MNTPLPLKVTMSEFRNNLSAYLDAVEAGKTVTITRRGRAAAILAGIEDLPEPIDIDDLKACRKKHDVGLHDNIIVRMRKEARY